MALAVGQDDTDRRSGGTIQVADNQIGRTAERILTSMSRRGALRRLGAGGLAAGVAVGSQHQPAQAQFAFSAVITEASARRAIAAINQALATGDMSGLDATFSPDYINHTPRRSIVTGQLFSPDLAGLKASLTEFRTFVPDGVLLVDDVVASYDTASILGSFRGTLGAAATTQPDGPDVDLRVGGVIFAKISGGRVMESWDYDDAAEQYGGIVAEPPVEEPVTDDGRGEVRDVSDFQEVSLEGVGTLIIEQGETESLTIEAEPKVLERIETEVQSGKLTIRPDRSFETSEPITYFLTVKQLTGIELAGAGRVEAAQLSSDDFRIDGSGAGAVSIDSLTANTLAVTTAGNVQAQLAGTVDSQTVVVSDAATYSAADLASRIATVTASGASQVIVNVTESLDARVSGAARVEYIGDPAVTEDVSGAGRVSNVG
jgi:Putative auto-transporter adhesin, head GIN domain/SnoaL-like polyketide cyclase